MTRGFFAVSALLLAGAPAYCQKAQYACDELMTAPLASTRITLARVNPPSATAALPEHCELEANINERTGADGKRYAIGFHLRLPVGWNGRMYFQGGGGLDGSLGNALGGGAFSKGYAVVSTDAGHRSEAVPGIGGALFGLDPQARLDYGYNALDVATRTAKRIIELHYGRKPSYSYFVGCSNGGRQAMMAAERFPEYFDGIVAGDPGFNLPEAALAQAWDAQAFAKATTVLDVNGQPYLPAAFSDQDLMLVSKTVLKKCDALDGLEDGMVNNLPACHIDLAELQCPSTKDASCLSPQQVKALRSVFDGPRDSRGRALYASWPYDAGIGNRGWRTWKIGVPAAPGQPLVNNAINTGLGGSAVAYVFVTPPAPVPANDLVRYLLNFNFDTGAPRIFEKSGKFTQSSMQFMTATSTDLKKFQRHGGKLILYHGGSDPIFSLNDTIRWYQGVSKEANGKVDQFARLFVIPGMNHCGGGPATDSFDALSAIADWVEHGKAPAEIQASAGQNSPWPGRTRPLCAYPKQPRYRGSGDINNAANFTCELP